MLEDAVRDAAAKAVGELLGLTNKPGIALLAASIPEVLLRIDHISAITGLSVPTIYRQMGIGAFPRPLKITNSARAWRLSEIMAWIDGRERDGGELTVQEGGE
jgi:prophage regulatory protein